MAKTILSEESWEKQSASIIFRGFLTSADCPLLLSRTETSFLARMANKLLMLVYTIRKLCLL